MARSFFEIFGRKKTRTVAGFGYLQYRASLRLLAPDTRLIGGL
jgi:hypothetical protein